MSQSTHSIICPCCSAERDGSKREIERTAKEWSLYFAAPEMLALLHECHGMFQQSPLNKDDDWLSSKLARDLRAIISKAEGKQ